MTKSPFLVSGISQRQEWMLIAFHSISRTFDLRVPVFLRDMATGTCWKTLRFLQNIYELL